MRAAWAPALSWFLDMIIVLGALTAGAGRTVTFDLVSY
jgi:hypothetical protein